MVCEHHSPAVYTARYAKAAEFLKPNHHVNDIGCGLGYGASMLLYCPGEAGRTSYTGYWHDKIGGGPPPYMPGHFIEADLDDPAWQPEQGAHLSTLFAVLEHVQDPERVAAIVGKNTWRFLFVGVVTEPTPGHLNNLTIDDIKKMFLPEFYQDSCIPEPEERGHRFRFRKTWA